jgi:glutaredoxin-related protein
MVLTLTHTQSISIDTTDVDDVEGQSNLAVNTNVPPSYVQVLELEGGGDGDGDAPLSTTIDKWIQRSSVVVFGDCPLTYEAIDLLANQLHVRIHISQDRKVLKQINQRCPLPAIFVKGKLIGGTCELYSLYSSKKLENELLKGIRKRRRTRNHNPTKSLVGAALTPQTHRLDKIPHPLAWFPYTVNGHATRITSLFILLLSAISAAFFYADWVHNMLIAILMDRVLMVFGGPSLSPVGMLAALCSCKVAPLYPLLTAGAPKVRACIRNPDGSTLGIQILYSTVL